MKILVKNIEKIHNYRLYKLYRLLVVLTEEEKKEFESTNQIWADSQPVEYIGDDVLNLCNIPSINKSEKVPQFTEDYIVSEEQYNYETWEAYEAAGWNDFFAMAVQKSIYQ